MRTGFSSVAFALAALVLWCSPATAQRVERPVFYVGDTWMYARTDAPATFQTFRTYRTTETRTITRISSDQYETAVEKISEGGQREASVETASLDFNQYTRFNSDQPPQEIKSWKWPADVGETWRYDAPTKDGIQVFETRVIGWEDVEVPAGKFRALKVEREMVSGLMGGYGRKITAWYSPEAKANVKMVWFANMRTYITIDATRELVSYKVK